MNDLTTYNKYHPLMQTGDLIEWHGYSLLDIAIRKRTGYDVNHSSLVVILNSPFTERRVLLFEALASGICITFASQQLRDYNGHAYYFQMKDEFAVKEFMATVEGIAFLFAGIPYDYKGILENLFSHDTIQTNYLFCSEFVQICHGGKIGDIAYWPGELPEKIKHWKTRNLLV
jgi:hypothetical protein